MHSTRQRDRSITTQLWTHTTQAWKGLMKSSVLEDLTDFSLDHCLDIIRQAIQCHGDLTPIPTRRFADGEHDHFIDSNQKHECRNIWTLRKLPDSNIRTRKMLTRTTRQVSGETKEDGRRGCCKSRRVDWT